MAMALTRGFRRFSQNTSPLFTALIRRTFIPNSFHQNGFDGIGFPPPLLRLSQLQQPEVKLPQLRILPSLIPNISPEPQQRPLNPSRKSIEDPSLTRLNFTIEAPTPIQEEKHAIRMLVIRRIKMNKHKLTKLRRKMRIVWAKVRLRRATWREKIFLNEKMALIKTAWKFDAKTHVDQLIRNVRDKPEPRPWYRPYMPESVVQQVLKMKADKKKKRFLSILDKRPPLI